MTGDVADRMQAALISVGRDAHRPAGGGASCGSEGEGTCAPCVAQLAAPADRFAAMLAAIADEPEPIVTLTHLLRLCREEHRVLWERSGDAPSTQGVAAVVEQVAGQLPAPGQEPLLRPPVRRALLTALRQADDMPAVLIARGLAELIDERYNHTFADWFRQHSPYQPGVGDPVPLDSPDLRPVVAMRATSPPWRLAHPLDETRHVRLAGDWAVQFRVVFDYSLFDTLAGMITADTVVATCHPNRGLDEFDLSRGTNQRRFPVRPRDLDRQRLEIDQVVAQATTAGASIVVLPELCVTEELATGLREWVQRPDGPRVLVAGSYHREAPVGDESRARRSNTAIAWVRRHDRPLTHDKYSPADRPVTEDIQPDGWPELRVYVTADGWHLTIAICRDLLNPQATNALSEAGVNLLLVPAMSETLVPFGGPVAHLVGTRQALVAVANNPGEWPDAATLDADQDADRDADRRAVRPARALFGHPGLGQQSRLLQPRDPGAGVGLMSVRSAAITWLPADHSRAATSAPETDGRPAETPTEPAWLAPLINSTDRPQPSAARPAQPVRLRPAAVLVLLTDSPDGPTVLLTERAADMTDYPAQLVFPGGVAEAGDGDPAATALREAHEEVGLDPRSVEVIGLLPPLALPHAGFLVDPVLAWSRAPALTGPVNHAEVAALHQVRLRDLDGGHTDPVPRNRPGAATLLEGPDLAGLGRMTSAVLAQLRGALHFTEPGIGQP